MSREPLRKRLFAPALIVGAAALVVGVLSAAHALDGWELFLYDLRLKGVPGKSVSDAIVPIAIDDESTEALGRWPWPRTRMAELAGGLASSGARVVVLDLAFKDATSPAEDTAFVEAIARVPQALAAYTTRQAAPNEETHSDDYLASLAAFERRDVLDLPGAERAVPDAPLAGRVFLPIRAFVEQGPGIADSTLDSRADHDGVVRRIPLLFRYRSPTREGWLPSLTLGTACRWWGVDPSAIRVSRGRIVVPGAAGPGETPRDVAIPIDAAGRMRILYATPGVLEARFRSAHTLLSAIESADARVHPKLAGAIALVYLSHSSSGDFHDSPTALDYPGGLLNAQALNTMVTGRFVRVAPAWAGLLAILIEAALLLWATARWKDSYRLGLVSVALLFATMTLGFSAWNAVHLMLTLMPLAVFAALGGGSLVLWRTFLEDRERIDLLFTLRALESQAMKERDRAKKEIDFAKGDAKAREALQRSADYGRFIQSLRDVETLEDTYIGKHYRLLHLIDEGGMGLVFKAEDEALNRTVAIKVLTRYSSKLLKRFQTEARAIGQLQHPNIVQVFAVGAEGDIPYIVMEYVAGRSLSQRIRDDGPLPPREAARVLLQVARGLDAAHLRQIIHRDVKTSNVLLTSDPGVRREGAPPAGSPTGGGTPTEGGSITAKIIDFGIAKFRAESGMTGEKEIVGTADYMSPEQGQGRDVDHRSDLYSLGITLYRTLTGRLPFKAEDTVAVLMKQMHDPLPDVRLWRPDTPEALIRIMMKLVEKKPEDRYQSAAAVCADLEEFLGSQQLQEPPAGLAAVRKSP